ncbi:MAG: response regulator [Prevotellaceae bacterium]|jgi:signal transduction histidine kinase/ligand-binding sensor domain-containing protein/AraC-like DNA-binding protein|nr:response regulator [Prevotellaceae bacterium]
MRTRICFFILLLFTFTIRAQEGKLFTADNELSSSMVNALYQDHTGMIWIATEDGLNRYDGAKFTTYRNDPDNPYSLHNNHVRVMYEDARQHFFVGTLNGLQRYDRATDRFTHIPVLFGDGTELTPNISSIITCSNGDVLIGTSGHSLFKLETQGDSLIARQYSSLINAYAINYMYEDRRHRLWIATENNGLYRVDTTKPVDTLLSADARSGAVQNYTGYNSVSSVCEDTNGTLYIGSLTRGLYRYDEQSDRFIQIPRSEGLPVKSLYATKQHKLLIGTDGNGLKRYDAHRRELTNNTLNVTTFNPDQAKVHSILEDNAGNLWFGLFQKGVLLVPANINGFQYIGYKSHARNLIGSNCIMAICKDHTGMLWMGTDNDGLYGINVDGSRHVHYAPRAESKQAAPAVVMTIFEDSQNNLWIGSYLQGMASLDPKSGRFDYIPLRDAQNNPVLNVYAFAEDRDGNLWIGTMGGGLFRLDIRTRRITGAFNTQAQPNASWGEANSLNNAYINCLLYSEHDNRLYIGTFDGVGCLDLTTMNFISPLNARRILAGDVVYSLHLDSSDNIWIGTAKGLKQLDHETGHISEYTRKDGLPNNLICGIQEDGSGTIWVSTGYGISRFYPPTHSFINFYASDGLQGNEFSKRVSFAAPDGEIFFGGTGGVTFFFPQEIGTPYRKPDIRITGFYLYNRAVIKGMKSGQHIIIDTAVMDASTFHLSHNDNTFSIEVSAMEFYGQDHIHYMYSLNDGKWTDMQQGTNRVSFGDLSPGTYRFRFRSASYNSLSDTKTITVVITPAWYASPAAKTFYVLMILLALYGVVMQVRQRIRTRQAMLEHRHAEQINEAKIQFFINISHEIRTPMSLIISPLQKLMNTDHDPERTGNYRTIYRNAERILHLVNQLMDVRKIDKRQMKLHFREMDMKGLVQDLYELFEQQAAAKQITFTFLPEAADVRAWVDPKSFDKVIMNVLSNALKFTPKGGTITIRLHTGNDPAARPPLQHYVEIAIEDSGIGIPEAERERIFERFYQVNNNYNNSVGTGVGLHLCRSLVELHHGTIRVEANIDGEPGTSFLIRLPLGNEHLTEEEIDRTLPDDAPLPDTTGKELPHTESVPADTPYLQPNTRYRIMVVEDDEEIRHYICRELKKDFHISTYTNGKDALNAILLQAPDLVISDVMMPEMDGLTLCRKIKRNVNINYLPVMLLTARTREEDTLEGVENGADLYITKPFNIEMVRKSAMNLIRNRDLMRNRFSGSSTQEERLETIDSNHFPSADEQLMDRIMECINRHIAEPAFTIDTIALEVGISRVHLYRKLKEMTGQPPRDFLRNIRLKQAAELLKKNKYTVKEIVTMTGFMSAPHFTTCFKEMYGVPPSQYAAGEQTKS